MSSVIDERVVQMAFDNSRFEKNVSTSISTLDKLKSALKLDGASKGLEEIEKLSGRFDMSGIGSAVETISSKFSAFGILGVTVLQNLAQEAYNTGKRIVESLTIDQIMAGWGKYAEKTTAVQTIMAATAETWERDANAVQQAAQMVEKGVDPQRAYECAYAYQEVASGAKTAEQAAKDLGLTVAEFNELAGINANYIGDNFNYAGSQMDYVNEQMEKLNWFTDETSYNFTDMAGNIGKFTANNIPLSQATTAMEGIATWAAASGQSASEASRAMYNMAQAIGVGSVKLQDWKSIENANMATAKFKKTVLETAVEMGTLTKAADGTYQTLKGTTVTVENFSQTLSEGWFSKDVLVSTLNEYGQFTDQLYNLSEASELTATDILELVEAQKKNQLTNELLNSKMGDCTISAEELRKKVEELASEENQLGYESFKAAQEAKTFEEAMDATKDAASTQWMNIFENIFGSYERARHVWTDFAGFLYDTMVAPLEKIRELSEGLIAPLDNFGKELRKQAGSLDVSSSQMLKYVIAMREGTMTTNDWYNEAYYMGVEVDELTGRVEKLSSEVYGDFVDALSESSKELGINSDKMFDFVEQYKNGTLDIDEAAKSIGVSTEVLTEKIEGLVEIGNTAAINRIISGLQGIANVIFAREDDGSMTGILGKLLEGFQKVIPPIELTKEGLLGLIKRFQEFGESLQISEALEERLTKAGEGLASVLKFIGNTLKNLWDDTAAIRTPLKYLAETITNLVLDIVGLGTKLDTAGKKSSLFASICSYVGSIIYKLSAAIRKIDIEKIQSALQVVGNVLKFVWNTLKNIWDATAPLRSAIERVIVSIGSLIAKLFSLGNGMDTSGLKGEALRKICEFLANIIDKVASAIDSVNLDKLKEKFSGVATVFEGLRNVFNWIVEKISSFNLGETFGKVADYIKEKFLALKDFLAGVDWGAVLKVGLTGGIGALLGAKLVKWFKADDSIIGSILGFFKNFEEIPEKIGGVFESISSGIKSLTLGTKAEAIKAIATAILELAVALLVLGFVNYDKVAIGIGAITALMAEIVGVMMVLQKTNEKKLAAIAAALISAAAAMLILAVALAVLAGAVALFTLVARMDGIEKGFIVLAATLAVVTAALFAMSKMSPKVIVSAVALVVLAAALIVLAGAIALFTLVAGTENIGTGIALFVGALILVIAALTVMSELSPKVIVSAVALLILSAAMIVLAGALLAFTLIAGMANAETGLMMLCITLGAVTIALLALGAAGPAVIAGAAALLIAAVACLVLAAAVAITAAILPLLSEGLAALGDGIGRGVTSIGEGIKNFITSLSEAVISMGEAIGSLIESIGTGIGEAIQAIGEGFGGAITAVGEGVGSAIEAIGSGLGDAVSALGEGVADAISDVIASVGEGIGRGITSISDAIGTFGDNLSNAAFGIQNLGNAVRSLEGIAWASTALGIGELGLALKKLKVEDLAMYLNDASSAVVRTCTEMVNSITAAAPLMSSASHTFGKAFASGISEAQRDAQSAGSDLGSSATSGINTWAPNYTTLGRNVAIGFANGIYDRIGEVSQAVSDMASAAVRTIQISIDSHSPSRVTEKFGGYFSQGFANGISEETDTVTSASETMVNSSLRAIEQAKNLIAAILQDDFTPTITPVVDMSNVESASSMLGSAFGNGRIGLSGELSDSVSGRLASAMQASDQTINNNTGDTLYITNNIYASEGMNTEEVADAVMSQMQAKMARRNVALGA